MSMYVVTDPATGEVLETVPEATAEQVESALAAAAQAAAGWGRTTTADERAALLHKLAQLHRERREELAQIIVTEMGKPM